MKKFSFEPPHSEESQRANWEQLISNTKTQEYDPFNGQTPSAAGFTNATVGWGTYSTMGPIVFFSINMYASGLAISWLNGTQLRLPISAAIRDVSVNAPQQHGLVFPATSYSGLNLTSSSAVSVFQLNPFGRLLTANGDTTGDTEVNISGWYFR
jgi:hypothetical protein